MNRLMTIALIVLAVTGPVSASPDASWGDGGPGFCSAPAPGMSRREAASISSESHESSHPGCTQDRAPL